MERYKYQIDTTIGKSSRSNDNCQVAPPIPLDESWDDVSCLKFTIFEKFAFVTLIHEGMKTNVSINKEGRINNRNTNPLKVSNPHMVCAVRPIINTTLWS